MRPDLRILADREMLKIQRIGCGLHFDASCFGYLLRVREGARHRRVGYAGFECYVADTRLHGASE